MYIMFPNYKVRTNIKSESYKYLKEKFKGDNIKETVENLKTYFEDLTDSEFNEEQLAEQLHSNEGRVEFLKNITDSLVDLILKNQKNPQIAEIIKDLDIKPIGLTYINSNSNNEKSLQNKLIEIYKSAILHESNISKIMTPLDHVFVKMDAQNIVPPVDKDNFDIFDAFMDIDTKYSFLAGLAGVGQLANAFSDYAMGSASNYYLRNVNISSKYANTYTQTGDVYNKDLKVSEEKEIDHTSFDKKTCVTLTDKELSDWVNSFNSRTSKKINKSDFEYLKTIPISDTLSAIMNAFVDIAKDPYITNIQWNMMTTNVGNLLVRAGVHPFRALSFIAQPIIGEYIEFVSQYENNDKRSQVRDTKVEFQFHKVGELLKSHSITVDNKGNKINAKILYDVVIKSLPKNGTLTSEMFKVSSLSSIIRDKLNLTLKDQLLFEFNENEIKYLLDQHYLYFTNEVKNYVLDFDLKNLRNAIFENNPSVQASVFNSFLNLLQDSKKMKANIDASKFGVGGMGKNTTDLLMVLNKVSDIQNKQVEGFDSKMYHINGESKLLGHRYEMLQKVANLINKNPNLFVSANQSVWNSYNLISNMIYGKPLENEELADKLEKTFYTYLISGFEPFKLSASEKINLIDNLPKKFNEFKGKYKQDYYILDQLQVKPGEKRNYIGIANKNNSKEYVDRMVNSWNELLKYHPEFATELIQYSFVTSGFNLGLNTFYNYIPPSFMLQNGFNDYIKYYSNTVDLIDNSFIDHFFLNNLDDSQIVKYVDRNSVNLEKSKKYGTLAIVLNENAGRFIKIGTEYYQNINNVDGEFVYSPYIKVKGGFSKIKPLSVKDKKGFSVYNFSAGDISLSAETLKDDVVKALTDIFNDSELSNEVIQPASNLLEDNTQPDIIKTKQEVKSDVISKTLIQMQPQNVEKILNGTKTTTIRESIPKGGNITVGETKIVNFGGKDFYVTNRGHLTIQEAGGLENILKSEGLKSIDDFMYNQSKNWAKGNGKMYVFDIKESKEVKSDVSKINIYAGTGENVELSNFAIRPFIIGGDEFQSVEQYFQYQKWNYLKDNISEEDFKYSQKIADDIINTSNGAKLKSLGRMFKGLDSKNWNENASKEMKIALKASFEQNDKAKEILLSTGNSELTHTQDSGKWKIEFPKLLMEVREELGGQKFISNKPQQLSLFEDKSEKTNNYNFDILRDIAKQKKVRIIDLIDHELKKPIIYGKTTITHIIPNPTIGNFKIIFKRPSGEWMVKIENNDNKIRYILYQNVGDEKESSFISKSSFLGEFTNKSTIEAIPSNLLNEIKNDLLNVPLQNDITLNEIDFKYTESIDKKYGIKKTLGDILNENKSSLFTETQVGNNLGDTTGKQLTLFEPLNEEEQQKLKEIKEICKPKK